MGNLDPEVGEEILFALFSHYGNIQLIKIMRHLITHKSRGFGFVTFRTRQEAVRAQKGMNGVKVLNSPIKVYLKEQYDSLDPQANVVLLNVAPETSEAEVTRLAEPFGPVFSVKLVGEEPGEAPARSGWKAFVQFEELGAARKAVQALNGSEFRGLTLLVEPANKRNKIMLRADFSDDVAALLAATLAAWAPVELGSPEPSTDRTQCIVQARFENETQARGFLQDFVGDRAKCELIRPADQGRLRTREHEVPQEKL